MESIGAGSVRTETHKCISLIWRTSESHFVWAFEFFFFWSRYTLKFTFKSHRMYCIYIPWCYHCLDPLSSIQDNIYDMTEFMTLFMTIFMKVCIHDSILDKIHERNCGVFGFGIIASSWLRRGWVWCFWELRTNNIIINKIKVSDRLNRQT